MRVAQAGLSRVLELLFPSNCVECGADGFLLCDACVDRARPIGAGRCRKCVRDTGGSNLCGRCASSPPPLSSLLAAYEFEGAIRKAVHRLKYDDLRALGPVLGGLIADNPRVTRLRPEAVVPVPLHPRRERERGYNQAALLAKPVALTLGAPIRDDLLRRTASNPRQVEMGRVELRTSNVAGIFEASPIARGVRILLVDDVATSGSTLNECARALLDAGARRVDAAVVAKEM